MMAFPPGAAQQSKTFPSRMMSSMSEKGIDVAGYCIYMRPFSSQSLAKIGVGSSAS